MPENHDSMLWWEKVGLVVVAVLLLGGGFVLNAAGDVREAQRTIQANQEEGRIRGLKNRAIDCEQSIAMGVPLHQDHPCNDAEVLEFYDPDEVRETLLEARAGTVAAVSEVPEIKALVCRLLGVHDRNDPACVAEASNPEG